MGEGAGIGGTLGVYVACLFLLFVLFSLFVETLVKYVEKKAELFSKALYHAALALKNELFLVGAISLLLAAIEGDLESICINGGDGDYGSEDIHAGETTVCPPGKKPLWNLNVIHQTHMVLLFVAIIHIVYVSLTIFIMLWRLQKWRVWEEAAKLSTQIQHIDLSCLRFTLGSNVASHWLRVIFAQFTNNVNQPVYHNMRLIFAHRFHEELLFDPRFNYCTLVEETMNREWAEIIETGWGHWLFAAIFIAVPDYCYLGAWMTGIGGIASLIIGSQLVSIHVYLCSELMVKYKDDILFGRMASDPAKEHRWKVGVTNSALLARKHVGVHVRRSHACAKKLGEKVTSTVGTMKAVPDLFRGASSLPQAASENGSEGEREEEDKWLARGSVPVTTVNHLDVPLGRASMPVGQTGHLGESAFEQQRMFSFRRRLPSIHEQHEPPPPASVGGVPQAQRKSWDVKGANDHFAAPHNSTSKRQVDGAPDQSMLPATVWTVPSNGNLISDRQVAGAGEPHMVITMDEVDPTTSASGAYRNHITSQITNLRSKEADLAPDYARFQTPDSAPGATIAGAFTDNPLSFGKSADAGGPSLPLASSIKLDHSQSRGGKATESVDQRSGTMNQNQRGSSSKVSPVVLAHARSQAGVRFERQPDQSGSHEPDEARSHEPDQSGSHDPAKSSGCCIWRLRLRGRTLVWNKRTASGRLQAVVLQPMSRPEKPSLDELVEDVMKRSKMTDTTDAVDLFWLRRPAIVRYMLQFIYFENSLCFSLLIMGFFYGYPGSAWVVMPQHALTGTIIVLVVNVLLLLHNALIVLPVYALIIPVGSSCPTRVLKRAVKEGSAPINDLWAIHNSIGLLSKRYVKKLSRLSGLSNASSTSVPAHPHPAPEPPLQDRVQRHGSGREAGGSGPEQAAVAVNGLLATQPQEDAAQSEEDAPRYRPRSLHTSSLPITLQRNSPSSSHHSSRRQRPRHLSSMGARHGHHLTNSKRISQQEVLQMSLYRTSISQHSSLPTGRTASVGTALDRLADEEALHPTDRNANENAGGAPPTNQLHSSWAMSPDTAQQHPVHGQLHTILSFDAGHEEP